MADAAGCLNAESVAYGLAHERDRVGGRTAGGVETGGSLDKVRLGGCGGLAGEDNGVVGKRGRLDDDLEHLARDGIAHGLDFGLQILGAALDGQGDIDDHVHLSGAISNRAGCLSGLNLRLYGTGGKAHDGGDVHGF